MKMITLKGSLITFLTFAGLMQFSVNSKAEVANPAYTFASSKGSLFEALQNAKQMNPSLALPTMESMLNKLQKIYTANEGTSATHLVDLFSELTPMERAYLIKEISQVVKENKKYLEQMNNYYVENLEKRHGEAFHQLNNMNLINNYCLFLAAISTIAILVQISDTHTQHNAVFKLAQSLIALDHEKGLADDKGAARIRFQTIKSADLLQSEAFDKAEAERGFRLAKYANEVANKIEKLYYEVATENKAQIAQPSISASSEIAVKRMLYKQPTLSVLTYSTLIITPLISTLTTLSDSYTDILNNKDIKRAKMREEWVQQDISLMLDLSEALVDSLQNSDEDMLKLIDESIKTEKRASAADAAVQARRVAAGYAGKMLE